MIFDIHEQRDVLKVAQEHNVKFVRLQFVDILGNPKNIVIPASRLEEAMNEGMPFDGSSIAGYATVEESDKIAKPDPKSFIILPETIEKRTTAKMNCDIYETNGNALMETPNLSWKNLWKKLVTWATFTTQVQNVNFSSSKKMEITLQPYQMILQDILICHTGI